MSAAHVPPPFSGHHFSGLRGHDWQPLLLALTTALIVVALAAITLALLTTGDVAKEEPPPVTVNQEPEVGTP